VGKIISHFLSIKTRLTPPVIQMFILGEQANFVEKNAKLFAPPVVHFFYK
jgi:hypothetical protein